MLFMYFSCLSLYRTLKFSVQCRYGTKSIWRSFPNWPNQNRTKIHRNHPAKLPDALTIDQAIHFWRKRPATKAHKLLPERYPGQPDRKRLFPQGSFNLIQARTIKRYHRAAEVAQSARRRKATAWNRIKARHNGTGARHSHKDTKHPLVTTGLMIEIQTRKTAVIQQTTPWLSRQPVGWNLFSDC